MIRSTALLLASGLLAGASPLPLPPPLPANPPATVTARLDGWLPLPPPLPTDPPTDQAAPVPDANIQTPNRTGPGGTAFALRVYPMQQLTTAEAYPPGSAYESPEQRKPMQPPGFMVTVPLK